MQEVTATMVIELVSPYVEEMREEDIEAELVVLMIGRVEGLVTLM